MLRIMLIVWALGLPINVLAEVLVIEKRSHTINGVTTNYVLEVNIEDIKNTPKLDPANDSLPISMKRAIELATVAYASKYDSEPRGVASVSLNHFPSWDYRDRWHFKVDIVGNPNIGAVVLFSGKVVFPREL